MTKDQWKEEIYGDSFLSQLSKDDALFKVMMKELDRIWEIYCQIADAFKEVSIANSFVLSEN